MHLVEERGEKSFASIFFCLRELLTYAYTHTHFFFCKSIAAAEWELKKNTCEDTKDIYNILARRIFVLKKEESV